MTTPLVDRDRGLGSAYERYVFYQRLAALAKAYDIHSMLEGPLDGMAGIAGVHGVGLAMQGVDVTVAVDSETKAELARGVYASVKAPVTVHVTDTLEGLPQADLVLAYHALPIVPDWRAYLKALAAHAKKLLVVTVCNPDNWGVAAIRTAARLRGIPGMEPPETWRTDVLAPALWEVGRVVDHVYFDCPWWPDLQVSAGQSLADRARQLLRQRKKDVQFTADAEGAQLAESFVYGPAKWPYFGGPGWREELLPALLRHPGFDGSKTRLMPRLAHLHGFVVDMRPRTPQARRRLGLAH